MRMVPNSSRGAHQWTNDYFVSTKTGGSILKGSNKRTLKHLGTGKIGYSPATDPVLITLSTRVYTLESPPLHVKPTALKLEKP